MTPAQQQLIRSILALLHRAQISMTAQEIADAASRHMDEVLPVLHMMQDADQVFMRNGWYWLSEAARSSAPRRL